MQRETLNKAQRAAVEHLAGPLLVIAGAGAGKTKTITERIRRLIAAGAPPQSILAITFTNKAAREMRERIAAPEVFTSTFHALGAQLLREQAQKLGLNRHFAIFDKEDSRREIKTILAELGFDPKALEPRRVLGAISRAKGRGENLATYESAASRGFFGKTVANVWRRYEESLQRQRALDFDDLILRAADLLARSPEILEHCHARWSYLHIDEYQDTNPAQYRLARLLVGPERNICVVGDIDQSIYSWRGADFRNLLRFQEDFPDAKVVILEENYRSTKNILAAAGEVIKKNRARHEKNLYTNNDEGARISLLIALDEREEGALVADHCAKLIEAGAAAAEIALLYRANFQSRVLEEAMLAAGLPYQVLGTRFFERQEIKDVLAFIRAALNPEDIVSVRRIINLPPRGLGKATLAKIFSGQEQALPSKIRVKLAEFRAVLAIIAAAAEEQKPSLLVKTAIKKSGLGGMWRGGGVDDLERLANTKELVTLALKYDPPAGGLPGEGMAQLLADAALASDQDSLDTDNKKKDGVKLMTVHAAKGLEFRYVFIVGLEQDLFPHAGHDDNSDDPANNERDPEEERRLFYVALTRAKEKLFLTYAQTRTIYGSRQVTLPSEFLGDIPEHLLEADPPAGGPPAGGNSVGFIDF